MNAEEMIIVRNFLAMQSSTLQKFIEDDFVDPEAAVKFIDGLVTDIHLFMCFRRMSHE